MRKNKILSVAMVTGLFMVFALGSSSSTSQSASTLVGKVDSYVSSEVSEIVSAIPTEEKFNNKSEIVVGDYIMDDKLKIVYVKSGEYIEDNKYSQPKDGNKYVYIDLYCENTGDKDVSVSFYSFDCFADGYSVEQHYGGSSLSASLSGGRNTSGKIVFEVPKDAKEIEFEYSLNFFTSERVKFIYEGEKDSGFVPETNVVVSSDSYHVGDILETKKLRITYLSCGQYESDNKYVKPDDGYKFLYAELEFENISDSDQHISSFSFDCFADGTACEQSFYLDEESIDASLSAGRKTKGKIMFEVPVDASVVEFEYLDNYWTSGRVRFLYE